MKRKMIAVGVMSSVLALASLVHTQPVAKSSPKPSPKIVGTEPLATAPYALNDPTPKLKLQEHAKPTTGREVAETFLALLSRGYDPGVEGCPGGSIPGSPEAYEMAWRMMGPERQPLKAFRAQWAGTVRIGVIQVEQIDTEHFFIELERVAWNQNSWTVSYLIGEIAVSRTENGLQVSKFEVCTEPLVVHNIGGHQGWQHDVLMMVRLNDKSPVRDPAWDVQEVRYKRRTAVVYLRHRNTTKQMTLRFARIVEGTWVLLSR